MNPDKTVHLPYGTKQVPLSPPRHSQQLLVQDPQKVISQALFRRRLETYLRQNALDLSRPMLVIADKTRLCGYPDYLPVLLNSLEQFGMNEADIKIIIGYGTHPRQCDEECLQGYGEVYHRYSFIHHNCQEKDFFKELGHTSRGTPIRFRRDLIDASAIITMGPVCHHYFAGYGGGRKLIFPGCGEREAIYANHGLYLDPTARTLSTGCQPGLLVGNPLAEDLFEIEEKLPADLSIHGILDSHGDLCDLIVGRGRTMFFEACQVHGENCEISAPGFDTVVASCGGHPKDINFIQSHKAIHNAAMFVQDGGLLLIYAKCCEGIGSKTFLPWFEKGSFDAAFRELAHSYEGNGGTALAMMTKLQRIRIGMVTGMDKKSCGVINVERWSHDRVCDLLANLKEPETIGLIPNAGLLVRRT